MKNTLQHLLALALILSCLNYSYAQPRQKQAPIEIDEPIAVHVAVKVYQCPHNGQSLLAYDPGHHNLFVFGDAEYSVTWKRNGQPVSSEVMLGCAGTGMYQVLVVHRQSGATGAASFRIVDEGKRWEKKARTGF